MRRYYFDVREDDNLQTDDEGRDFSSFAAAQGEATVSLAELALGTMAKHGADHRMSIEVRDERGPVQTVKWFEIERLA
ncbi:hypothetical protein V1290_002525 [Bradyrhizobium sp. AZCC 1578]|uniref:DUF6894 family protein n=1 Tax=Bradyrhizobium sp. AZCC 1578 TaxID=3117027 RepID=UPI002FF0847B